MDRFFKNSPRALQSSDLHITGVVSMFIASKYEDVIPLLMKTVVHKVGHGKFKQSVIEEREIEVLKALQFKVGAPTILEFIDRYLVETGLQTNKKLREICVYLAKLSTHDYDLCQKKPSELAGSIMHLALKVYEKIDASINTEAIIIKVARFADVDQKHMK